MHQTNFLYCLLFSFHFFIISGCQSSFVEEQIADNKSPCEKAAEEGISYYRPVVVVHGFLASGDTYALQYQRFSENCYGENYVRAFDWNSTGFGANQSAALDAFINNVLEETGADKVDLAGHSAGGGVCYTYLSNAAYAAKVAHYAHLGSSAQARTSRAGWVGSHT